MLVVWVRAGGEFLSCFRKETTTTTTTMEHGFYGYNGLYGFGKTPEYVALIAEPVRGPNP